MLPFLEAPFELDCSGCRLSKTEEGFFEVVQVETDSPASEAGLKRKDLVVRINHADTSGLKAYDMDLLMKKAGETHVLVVSRKGKEFETKLKLRRTI